MNFRKFVLFCLTYLLFLFLVSLVAFMYAEFYLQLNQKETSFFIEFVNMLVTSVTYAYLAEKKNL